MHQLKTWKPMKVGHHRQPDIQAAVPLVLWSFHFRKRIQMRWQASQFMKVIVPLQSALSRGRKHCLTRHDSEPTRLRSRFQRESWLTGGAIKGGAKSAKNLRFASTYWNAATFGIGFNWNRIWTSSWSTSAQPLFNSSRQLQIQNLLEEWRQQILMGVGTFSS